MGATKRTQMSNFPEDWPDQIWARVEAMNGGDGAAWRLALAAIAVTGCRPSALERGVTFKMSQHLGRKYIEAFIPGSKLTRERGQPSYTILWGIGDSHRPDEISALAHAISQTPDSVICVKYDAEAISTRLRETSRALWPRRKYCITAYCYRELLSATAKAGGVDPIELAQGLGHRSAESQGAYSRAGRIKKSGKKPWASVTAPLAVKTARKPMARFRAASALKKAKGKNQI